MIIKFPVSLIGREHSVFLSLHLREDVEEWLVEHCSSGGMEQGRKYHENDWGWWYETSNDNLTMIPMIKFKNPDHAVLFKLTWCGR